MSGKREHTGIDVNNHKCRRCMHCIQLCPAKAIKIETDTIRIMKDRCILCGSCVAECPQQAISYRSGLGAIRGFIAAREKTIACLDPALPGAFEKVTPRQVVTALKKAGFTEVWEGAFGTDLISREYQRLIEAKGENMVISSFCPVIVFYVQKYLPQLIPNLAPVVSPMIAVGRAARMLRGPDWKVVYITPCLAQMKEMDAPEVAGVIDQVLTFHDLGQLIGYDAGEMDGIEETDFDGPRPYLGRIVPVIGGLYRSTGTSFDVLNEDVSVTYGQKRAIGALNQLAGGMIRARFLDFVYCFGCVDGPFVDNELSALGRRQIISRYVNEEMAKQDKAAVDAELDAIAERIDLSRTYLNMEQRLPIPTEDEIQAILKKLGKEAPNSNLDCRACGYPTCRDKAIAVAQGLARIEYCLPYLLERSRLIYSQLEKSHRELQLSHQELETAQAQLIRTEKLAALGQLSAGVAHEINNPLGTITIYGHLLMKNLEVDDPRREDAALIVNEANRAKEIVQGLLSFARETKLRPGDTDINAILDDVLGLVANQPLFHNIVVKKAFSGKLPTIIADATQLKQVFLNIVLNAAQAMEGKGKLTITSDNDDEFAKIKIHDTGPGIPPEILEKLFSPFFTTKEKGTGLGLAISYGIIERHGGKIEVATKLGKGTTFTILLPVSPGTAQEGTDDRTRQNKRHTIH